MSERSEFNRKVDEALEESDREIAHLVRVIKHLEARLDLQKDAEARLLLEDAGYRCTCGKSERHLRAVK